MSVKAGPLQQNSKEGSNMKWFRTLLNKDHVKNEVRSRIHDAIEVHDNLLTMLKKRKLLKILWYGEDKFTGDRERSNKERNAEEGLGGQHKTLGMSGVWRTAEDRDRWNGIVEWHLWCPVSRQC